ncbi:cation transporter [Sphingorhabdus lutea]|uniref:Cation transporter n=1 Tax=Sphingorhabdus lutea TaxID=1913578 RepID=A0A1L3JDJ9_9SPHN|nr:cation diffusion facilitator family transporter [Sphingorhabdus lutea]APG63123.1 cation transporter [Sphingorhabdus lutea]
MSSGHDHGTQEMSDARLVWAVIVNVALTVAQIIGGIFSGSLSLIADALHNFSDAASLGIALFARKLGRREADQLMTFGYAKAELVAALINLTSLLIIGFYLLVESFNRFIDPQPIEGWTVIIVAGIALVIDIVTAVLVYAGTKNSLNMKAAFLHNVSDALASIGVIIAGVLIILYDFYVADLIITVIIAGYVIYQGINLMPQTIRYLMDAVPEDIEFAEIRSSIELNNGVESLHHIHIWSISEHRRALEAHIVPKVDSFDSFEAIKTELREMLKERFHIEHATFEACVSGECE